MITDQKAEAAVSYMRQKAGDFARAKALRTHLEEFRKTRKALGMREAEERGFKTAALQEREAYAADAYRELLDGLRVAVEDEERLRWELESAKLTVEIYRTQSANNRGLDRAAA